MGVSFSAPFLAFVSGVRAAYVMTCILLVEVVSCVVLTDNIIWILLQEIRPPTRLWRQWIQVRKHRRKSLTSRSHFATQKQREKPKHSKNR
jgi:hypothetical protein